MLAKLTSLLRRLYKKEKGKPFWLFKWTIRWILICALPILAGCAGSGNVQAVESIWKWPNFLQNLLRSVDINQRTTTTIYGVDPKYIIYAFILTTIVVSIPWLVVVILRSRKIVKLKRIIKTLVVSIDGHDDIKSVKRHSKMVSKADRFYRKIIDKYINI